MSLEVISETNIRYDGFEYQLNGRLKSGDLWYTCTARGGLRPGLKLKRRLSTEVQSEKDMKSKPQTNCPSSTLKSPIAGLLLAPTCTCSALEGKHKHCPYDGCKMTFKDDVGYVYHHAERHHAVFKCRCSWRFMTQETLDAHAKNCDGVYSMVLHNKLSAQASSTAGPATSKVTGKTSGLFRSALTANSVAAATKRQTTVSENGSIQIKLCSCDSREDKHQHCPFCDVIGDQQMLSSHLRDEHPTRFHTCKCGLRFSGLTHLRKHVEVADKGHYWIMPKHPDMELGRLYLALCQCADRDFDHYHCLTCNYVIKSHRNSDMYAHIDRSHKELVHRCSLCRTRFITDAACQTHTAGCDGKRHVLRPLPSAAAANTPPLRSPPTTIDMRQFYDDGADTNVKEERVDDGYGECSDVMDMVPIELSLDVTHSSGASSDTPSDDGRVDIQRCSCEMYADSHFHCDDCDHVATRLAHRVSHLRSRHGMVQCGQCKDVYRKQAIVRHANNCTGESAKAKTTPTATTPFKTPPSASRAVAKKSAFRRSGGAKPGGKRTGQMILEACHCKDKEAEHYHCHFCVWISASGGEGGLRSLKAHLGGQHRKLYFYCFANTVKHNKCKARFFDEASRHAHSATCPDVLRSRNCRQLIDDAPTVATVAYELDPSFEEKIPLRSQDLTDEVQVGSSVSEFAPVPVPAKKRKASAENAAPVRKKPTLPLDLIPPSPDSGLSSVQSWLRHQQDMRTSSSDTPPYSAYLLQNNGSSAPATATSPPPPPQNMATTAPERNVYDATRTAPEDDELDRLDSDVLWNRLGEESSRMKSCCCGMHFMDFALYVIHRQTHASHDSLQCGFCGFRAEQWFQFLAHINSH